MKTIDKLRASLARVGATLDDTGYALHCDAPPGYVWQANGSFTLTIHYATSRQSWLSEALRAEKANLELGLWRVDDLDRLAEIRHNLDDDTWGAPAGAPETLAVKL